MYPWLVIGVSGVTGGGKTSLTYRLRDLLSQHFYSRKHTVNVVTISQDDFFLQSNDPRHVVLPSLGHKNWEIPTAVDFNRLYQTAVGIITGEESSKVEKKHESKTSSNDQCSNSKIYLNGILLIEGFLILNHEPTRSLCHLGYYLVLSRATCEMRRSRRSYDPPDIPGYFEQCVWPEHVHHREEVIGKGKLVDQSDPLSMSQLQKSLEEENIYDGDKSSGAKQHSSESSKATLPALNRHGKQPCAVVDKPFQKLKDLKDLTEESHDDNINASSVKSLEGDGTNHGDNLWMRLGGNVLPLEGFGQAGLAMVSGVRVLNGGAISKEEMARLVLEDVLDEMKRLTFE